MDLNAFTLTELNDMLIQHAPDFNATIEGKTWHELNQLERATLLTAYEADVQLEQYVYSVTGESGWKDLPFTTTVLFRPSVRYRVKV